MGIWDIQFHIHWVFDVGLASIAFASEFLFIYLSNMLVYSSDHVSPAHILRDHDIEIPELFDISLLGLLPKAQHIQHLHKHLPIVIPIRPRQLHKAGQNNHSLVCYDKIVEA